MKLSEIIQHYPEFSGVHPACLAVPWCSKVEFQRLCESIRTGGLRHSLLRTKDHQLLDGKCRLVACHTVGVAIRFETDPGIQNPWDVVHSLNICRKSVSNAETYFPDGPADIEATCPTCQRTKFARIVTTEDRYRCRHCGWMIRIEAGKVVDAIDWTRAGKRGSR